jgi:hypothetical protein
MNVQKEQIEFVTAKKILEARVKKFFAEHPKLYNERTANIVEFVLGLDHDAYVDDPEVYKALRALREIVADLTSMLGEQVRFTRWTLEHIRYLGLLVEVKE